MRASFMTGWIEVQKQKFYTFPVAFYVDFLFGTAMLC